MADKPDWIVLGKRLRWFSQSQKIFVPVLVSKVDDEKRQVIVTFESDKKVWKSVPFSKLGSPECPLQAEEADGVASKSSKDSGAKSGVKSSKSSGRKSQEVPDSKDAERDGSHTPDWWQAEKKRMVSGEAARKIIDAEEKKRKKEEDVEKERAADAKRRKQMVDEKRKVEAAFEKRKKEAEKTKLAEEEEWRIKLRVRREKESAEEEIKEKGREERRKVRRAEKEKKKAVDDEVTRKEKEKRESEDRQKKEAEALRARQALAEMQRNAMLQAAQLQGAHAFGGFPGAASLTAAAFGGFPTAQTAIGHHPQVIPPMMSARPMAQVVMPPAGAHAGVVPLGQFIQPPSATGGMGDGGASLWGGAWSGGY